MTHPERLGKYRITGVLGEGSMGVVYRGFDPGIRRVVALKTIRRSAGEDAESVAHHAARFRHEAQAAGRLTHPGIVGIYDFGDDGELAYIAMEFVPGHTLSAYLGQRVRFDVADTASIVTQLLEALAHAHEHKVWHRDIKPSNVIMTRSGRVKVADFGIARTEGSDLTQAGGLLGTPMYIAPEQFMGQAIDRRVDLYAVGVVLYQLVAGRPPFVGSAESIMYRVVHEPPPAPSAIKTGSMDPRFDAVAAKALAKDPARRYGRAEEFRDALAAALGQPAAPAVSADAVAALATGDASETTLRIAPPASSAPPSTHGSLRNWNPAVLAQLEAVLVRHVGPLAGTMVRRAARDCSDLLDLQSRLAEQITQDTVRSAFLAQLRSSAGGLSTGTLPPGTAASRHGGTGDTGGSGAGLRPGPTLPPQSAAAPATGGSRGSGGASGSGGSGSATPVSDAWLEQAQRVLAAQLGPIARVVVQRAAGRTRLRQPLCAQLVEAVPEAARAQVAADLARLGRP